MSDRFPGLGFDPAPGDLDLVRRCSREHGRAAAELDSLAVEVARRVAASASWRGAAAGAFDASLAPLPGQLRAAADAFSSLATRLSAWAEELEQLQQQARMLDRSASDALDRMRAAHARAMAVPDGSATFGALLGAGAHVVEVSDAEDELRGVTQRAEELKRRWRTAGRQVAAAVEAVVAAAPPVPRGFGELVWEHREGISLAADALSVASMATFAVPPLSAGLAVASTAGHTALAVHADGSPVDVAFGVGGLGLVGAASAVRHVAKVTPAADLAARGLDDAALGVSAVGGSLTVHKRVFGPPPTQAPPPTPSSLPALRSLLVAPVMATPGRKRP